MSSFVCGAEGAQWSVQLLSSVSINHPPGRGVPAFSRHQPAHLGLVLDWIGGTVVTMGVPFPVAPPACCGNVYRYIGPPMLLGDQMLGSALQVSKTIVRDAESGRESLSVRSFPDRKSAIDATALLRMECSNTEFGQSCHGQRNRFGSYSRCQSLVRSGAGGKLRRLCRGTTHGGRGRWSPDESNLLVPMRWIK